MNLQYREWLPEAAGLQGLVVAYWHVSGDGTKLPFSSVLPDGHIELVLNLGDPVGLAGPVFTGDQPERAIVGLMSQAFRLEYRGAVNTMGIRFHPARGAGFFGLHAPQLSDKLIPLVQICPALDRRISQAVQAHPALETEFGRCALDRVLLEQLDSAIAPDAGIVALVNRLTSADAVPLVADLARELGLSARQLQRRFRSAVGLSPKHYVRVLRFARVWQMASMFPEKPWATLAVEHGYADQAHLIREFRAFGAQPPTGVFSSDWYGVTGMSRVSGPGKGVRIVQDPRGKPRV